MNSNPKIQNNRTGRIFVMSGPSGVGKSTIYKAIKEKLPNLYFSISCTTRAPRPKETDGVDYYFISEAEFQQKIKNDSFAEYANVHGNYYGTLKSELLGQIEKGVDVLLDIDVQGAMQIKHECEKNPIFQKACSFIFIAPPSLEELERRLRSRNTETEDSILKRLANGKKELEHTGLYDYVLVNDVLDNAIHSFFHFINERSNEFQ